MKTLTHDDNSTLAIDFDFSDHSESFVRFDIRQPTAQCRDVVDMALLNDHECETLAYFFAQLATIIRAERDVRARIAESELWVKRRLAGEEVDDD
jgi:hypothetical protein